MSIYKVTFKRSNGTTGFDFFTENSKLEARNSFRNCYRHDTYDILDVEETLIITEEVP